MAEIEIATTTGRQFVLNADVIEQFRSGLRGAHLLQGEDGYDTARKIYNAMIDHRPAIIARCTGVADDRGLNIPLFPFKACVNGVTERATFFRHLQNFRRGFAA
jgi:hypothetical protein